MILFYPDNRFAINTDQTSCFEFPETNGGCNTNGCDDTKATELCKDLDGYPTDSRVAIKDLNMVSEIDIYIHICIHMYLVD